MWIISKDDEMESFQLLFWLYNNIQLLGVGTYFIPVAQTQLYNTILIDQNEISIKSCMLYMSRCRA